MKSRLSSDNTYCGGDCLPRSQFSTVYSETSKRRLTSLCETPNLLKLFCNLFVTDIISKNHSLFSDRLNIVVYDEKRTPYITVINTHSITNQNQYDYTELSLPSTYQQICSPCYEQNKNTTLFAYLSPPL